MKDVKRGKNNGTQKSLAFDGHGVPYQFGRGIDRGLCWKDKNFNSDDADYDRNAGRR